jgi:hypothetical protein
MSETNEQHLSAIHLVDVAKGVEQAAAAAPTADRIAQEQRYKKTERIRLEQQKVLTEELQSRLELTSAREGLGSYRVKVTITHRRPNSYYEAWFTAACLLLRHDYLLEGNKVSALTAKLFPAACSMTGYEEGLERRVWYAEFSPYLMEKVHKAATHFGPTDENCRSLADLAKLVRDYRDSQHDTGRQFPEGGIYFMGGRLINWFGNVRTMTERGSGKALCIPVADPKTGRKSWTNVVKLLTGPKYRVPLALVEQWQANAEVRVNSSASRRQEQDEAEAYTGSRFHS